MAQEWLASNPRKRPTTLARDADVIRVHLVPVLGILPAGLLRRSHIQQVVETMEAKGLRAKTIRTNYGVRPPLELNMMTLAYPDIKVEINV